ncbi:uncharacterized protein EMH_0095790 [Eimeria mitis]|uniref:Uncharacterized protein n=1 Tax=Eimeria mitis TaxID=44415 RepID=U6JR24_9EIME|nr:uncharacterized protein EMH_0095790 [Eimeria mitis]CDJ27879.1 hypothetical protein, conserved [Eimeria mitis]
MQGVQDAAKVFFIKPRSRRWTRAGAAYIRFSPGASAAESSSGGRLAFLHKLLTERQLERVAIRLKVYRNLKLKPRQQNKLAVIRDIGKIVPTEHRCELTKLLAASLDVVDPHHFLRLSKATTERLATQDEVGDGMPQSIMGDYTVGAELLRSQHRSKASQRSAALTDADGSEHLAEYTIKPGPPLTSALQAFSGCGKIQELEIFDDRLRTLDQTEDNTLQAKGEQAISDKLEKRFSPIFALAEFSSTQEKQNACSTYLRTFGVPCIDRLVYPEDAAVKTTLIATNLPFILTPDEIARILSFALVHDEEATSHYPGVCRIRMTNPKLFGYEQLLVEARSDAAEPFFLLPLHKKMPNAEAVDHGSPTERTKQGKDRLRPSRNAETSSSLAWKDTLGNDISEVSLNTTRSQVVESCEQGLLEKSASATGCNGYCESRDVVSAIADESIFIPSIVGLQTDEEMRYHQNTGRVPNVPGKKFDIGRHVVKKFLMNRLVLNNDGLFVLRFASFEAAEAAGNL